MATLYIRHQEIFEAVQFIQLANGWPEFDHSTVWINYALKNKLLSVDGSDLLWGYRELDRRVKPGNWIIRSKLTGGLEFKSDTDFRKQFELHKENAI